MSGVSVGLDHHPGRCVADSQVQHFPLVDEVVETLHDLLDPRGEVPIMDVEDVDVTRLELFEGRLDAQRQRFGIVGTKVRLLQFWGRHDLVGRCVFGGDDHLVPTKGMSGHPFTDPSLGLFTLVIVGTEK